jgi:hypothetical protein
MRDLIRNAMAMLRSGRLVALHLVGNAVLLIAAVLWLLIGEAHVTQLVFAVAAGLAILFLLLWLHSGTFAYSANPQPENFRAAFKPSFLRMLWLLLGSAILFWLMWHVSGWKDQEWQIGGYLYAKAPAALHPTRGVAVYYTWVDRAINFIFWYLTPGLLLPLIASRLLGAPILSWLKTLIQWRYWLSLAITTIVGVWCSELLLFWMPGKKLGAQTASLGLRVAAAYVLATAAWLATVGLLSYFVRRGSEKVGGKASS